MYVLSFDGEIKLRNDVMLLSLSVSLLAGLVSTNFVEIFWRVETWNV